MSALRQGNGKRNLRKLLHLPILLAGLCLASGNALALPTYFEFGAGLAKVDDTNSLTGVSGALNGYSIPFTFGLQLQNRPYGLLFSLAASARYVTGSNNFQTRATFMSVAPMLRIEFWKIVLGAGYTTFLYRDLSFGKYPSAKSMILEAQMLFPITPEIDFGLSAARQSVTAGSSFTSMEYTGFFRLNFGYSTDDLNKRRKFKGWRYPYGKPIW